MKKILKKIRNIVVIFIILFFALKGCVGTVLNVNEFSVYEKTDGNGQIDRVIFLKGSSKFIYSKNYIDKYENGLYDIKGSNAIHYFGSIYNVGIFPFGLRNYPNAQSVWKCEIKLIDKIGNLDQTTFGDIGEMNLINIVFYPNSLKFGNAKYLKVLYPKNEIINLKKEFNSN